MIFISKELVGKNDYTVGSKDYFGKINRDYYLDEFLIVDDNYKYYDALKDLSKKSKIILNEIYNDIRKNAKILKFISFSERKNLSRVVIGFNGICKLTNHSFSNFNKLLDLLNLFSSETRTKSGASIFLIEDSVKTIKNGGKVKISSSDRISTIKKAVNKWLRYAAGNDKNKTLFLDEIMKNKDYNFLTDVLNKYNFDNKKKDYTGKCGKIICSTDYCEYILKEVLVDKTYLKFMKSGDSNYAYAIFKQFTKVVREIANGLYNVKKNNDFVKDENGIFFKKAVAELEKCGLRCYDLCNVVDDLMWYVGGNENTIRRLQQKLNLLGITGQNGKLKEDGVYGRETDNACFNFINKLVHGSIPILTWESPLQGDITNVVVGSSKEGVNNVLQKKPTQGKKNGFQYFRVDPLHYDKKGNPSKLYYRGKEIEVDFNHINLNHIDKNNIYQNNMRLKFNHYRLSNRVYNALKDFNRTVKVVSAGGRWGGAWAGAKLGAAGGAAIGTYVYPGVGTLIGGFGGSLILGGIGAFGGEEFSKWVIDISNLEE